MFWIRKPASGNRKMKSNTDREKLIEVKELTVRYRQRNGFGLREKTVEALKDISFFIHRGETLALVGETGSGKSTIAMSILHFVSPDSGKVLCSGEDIWKYKRAELRAYHRKVQPVFQNADESLNPRLKIRLALADAVDPTLSSEEKSLRLRDCLSSVQLNEDILTRFPHQLSGGQKQRVCIARALATGSEMLVLDEAISSQDLSLQAHLLKLLLELKKKLSLTFFYISHDLETVRVIADRVGILKDGRLIEIGDKNEIFNSPKESYTQLLLERSRF
ncbi:MAG: dipeptide/oligopeptide/nickel ABC transporter ATP-binding protein [Candidatus Marinimicrobia bacterium]|nr:dipeptide/oligopeptide/nickel ABC transporter ATP-binding protein [Candidatus Neomarinimicrobiota bacterium]